MTDKKISIGIIGLGLIGGSIEKRLSSKPDLYEIKAVSKSQNKEYSIADLGDCDLVFVCSPQSQVKSVLTEIAALQAKDEKAFVQTIITDVASTKKKIKAEAEALGLKNFIAGHPMAGTEKQGYEAAFPELFENAKWILETKEEKFALLEKIIKEELGASIEYLDVDIHDQAVAVTSHLPLVLSLALAELGADFTPAKKTIGPGFKGMVRLANGNVAMGKEIISINKQNIKDFWQDYKAQVDSLLEANQDDLEKELVEIKANLQGEPQS